MDTRNLTREEYLSTFSGPNKELDPKKYDYDDIWPYVLSIPESDYVGYKIHDRYVPFIYRTHEEDFDHIFVSTKTSNAFILIILRRSDDTIVGHHLLDLNIEYGIEK